MAFFAETRAVAREDTLDAIARGLKKSERVPDARRRRLATAQRASVWRSRSELSRCWLLSPTVTILLVFGTTFRRFMAYEEVVV